MARANALVVVPPETQQIIAGQMVGAILLGSESLLGNTPQG
jgi:hypothetical protein